MKEHMNQLVSFWMEGIAVAQTGGSPAPGWVQFLPFVILLVMFYFLLIRPQQKKMKEHQELVASVKPGDKVVAAGGIHGNVTNVKDATVMLKISEQVKIEVEKARITLVQKD